MKKLIEKFIVWYLKRQNVVFKYENYVVRMFSMDYYDRLMSYASTLNHPNCRCYFTPVFNDTTEKEGEE